MIPQICGDDSAKTGCPIRKKRIIEENHHQSANSAFAVSPLPKSSDDDDSILAFKVKTLLKEFFASRGVRTPTGENPAATMA
jgi:hypothetical protein